ncbi:hypothetical protein [Amycolatopsis rubida]|uniref:Uncharacterized protein n=1 Tax=Amycolatopsis rubida TaxID=112413 RepID=A0A1I5X5N4_9PSEU|nr:hypothetical protein [Amycolatopsis rubida]SFQ27309.1 hypothetical protein SAMN05421854_11047 [Amycolatopsis rubida]
MGRPEDLEAVFVAEDGVEHRVHWSATMGARIGFESWVERDPRGRAGFRPEREIRHFK